MKIKHLNQNGFTLIEVFYLIALLAGAILSIGLGFVVMHFILKFW